MNVETGLSFARAIRAQGLNLIKRAYYRAEISEFLTETSSQILGELVKNHHFDTDTTQRNAWIEQINGLKDSLSDFKNGTIFLEFSIPRMGKRADIVILFSGIVFVVEFKLGAETYDRGAKEQVLDYALDLKNFHEGSQGKYLVPVLLATRAKSEDVRVDWSADCVSDVLLSNGRDLSLRIGQAISSISTQPEIDGETWLMAGYRPTPTIIEAAQALYQGHSVEEISRSDAGAVNLSRTSDRILEIISVSETNKRKSICFVTGVPGAGKTLAGLNICTRHLRPQDEECAVFLSGNGPLVDVLREALARDEVDRALSVGNTLSKKEARSKASAFIQNIIHFRDEALRSSAEPPEHVIVFDEAQRAWNQVSAEKFMVQKRGHSDFKMSEPEFLVSIMDRRTDWCVIVCLIGGGQEINTGEAGLLEWFDALQKRFGHWDAYFPDHINHKNYSWGQNLPARIANLRTRTIPELHLAVSMRSYRAEKVSDLVGAIIDGELGEATSLSAEVQNAYPIALTRDIEKAREWLRHMSRGSQRCGLVASSGAARLKPEGINVKSSIEPIFWFLNGRDDVRSSYYLEDVATEFDIQGLELDWIGVCWEADFRRHAQTWSLHSFKGTRWQEVKDTYRRAYLANAYRVLLTRARQGMIVFVPRGNPADPTRLPEFYDETYEFLAACGLKRI